MVRLRALLLAAMLLIGVDVGVGGLGAGASAVSAPARLTVHVSLSRAVVHMGERIRVSYTWTDGNGQLVDTNHIGTMAIRVIRNVACGSTIKGPHASGGKGSWWYTPMPAFVGPLNPTARVFVGFNVRTGGCAPIEDRTAGRWVTVEPAS